MAEGIFCIVLGIVWSGVIMILPPHIGTNICNMPKAKHYVAQHKTHTPKPDYKIPVPKRKEGKAK